MKRDTFIHGIYEKFSSLKSGEKLEQEKVKIAGRVKSIRQHGKLIFCDLEDFSDKIQVSLKLGVIAKSTFELFQEKLNVGDFIAVSLVGSDDFRQPFGQLYCFWKCYPVWRWQNDLIAWVKHRLH